MFKLMFNFWEANLNTQQTLGDRLKLLREKFYGNQDDFALALGCHQNTLSRYETGKRKPKTDVIEKICELTGISEKWLLRGEGEMYEGRITEIRPAVAVSKVPDFKYQDDDSDMINIPMVEARLSAGHGSWIVGAGIECFYAFSSAFLHRKGNPSSMVVMKVEGDSMSPEIRHNDVVLIDQNQTTIRLGQIYAVGFEDTIYLKRIDKLPGKILLKSVNPAYPPVEISTEEQEGSSFRVIGQVLWVGREY